MDVKKLSATRIKTWLECKYKYGCKYHNFHPEIIINTPVYFKLGTAVHAALEFAGKLVVVERLSSFDGYINDIVKEYYKEVAKVGLDDLDIIADGMDMLLAKLKRFEFDYEILSLEERFEADIDGVPVIGAMDRVVALDDDHVCVIDYKTSKTALTDTEMLNDLQVGTYDIIARQKYPEAKKVTICLDYLRLAPKTIEIPENKREANIELIRSVYEVIKASAPEDLKPSMHEFCPWCDYASVCPAVIKAKEELDNFDITNLSDIDMLADSRFKAYTLAKHYSLLKDKIDTKIKKILRESKADSVSTKDFSVTMRQNVYVKYNVHDVFNILGSDRFVKCVDVKKPLFEREAKKAGISEQELKDIREINFSKPILNVKPIKK